MKKIYEAPAIAVSQVELCSFLCVSGVDAEHQYVDDDGGLTFAKQRQGSLWQDPVTDDASAWDDAMEMNRRVKEKVWGR